MVHCSSLCGRLLSRVFEWDQYLFIITEQDNLVSAFRYRIFRYRTFRFRDNWVPRLSGFQL